MKELFMKIDPKYLEFPKFLDNDLEGLIFTYPNKFPGVVKLYKEIAKKVYNDPALFRQIGDQHCKELNQAFDKIKADYEKGYSQARKAGLEKELEFLTEIDQRLHKMYCYRFWIINYLFPDGPLHGFYVENLKSYARLLVNDIDLDIDEYEEKYLSIQRDLLQNDYADLYLQNALNCVKLLDHLRKNSKTKDILNKVEAMIQKDGRADTKKVFPILDPIFDLAYKKDAFGKELYKIMYVAIDQAEFRNTRVPVYTLIIHAIEFAKENKELENRHQEAQQRIKNYFVVAKKLFKKEDYELLKLSYEMVRNFTVYKDVMGEIDSRLLPLWMNDIVFRAEQILHEMKTGYIIKIGGPGAFYYFLSWYLPDNLKAKIFKVDTTDFNLNKI